MTLDECKNVEEVKAWIREAHTIASKRALDKPWLASIDTDYLSPSAVKIRIAARNKAKAEHEETFSEDKSLEAGA
jgi:hypothetical protein